MLLNPSAGTLDDNRVLGTIKSYDVQTGKGIIEFEGENGEELTITVSKDALVAEEPSDKFLITGQTVLFKRIEVAPDNWMAIQIRSENGDPIKHQWEKGYIKTFFFSRNDGTVQLVSDEKKIYAFNGIIVSGSTSYIHKAHCLFALDGDKVVSVLGLDGNPFPDDPAKLAKIPCKHEEEVKNREPGENYANRYELVHKAEPDVDGWAIPAVYTGKILFYHKLKGFGFVSPLDSDDQQDPANLYFRKQNVCMKGMSMDPKLESGIKIDFQVGRQINGKPCATYIYLHGGKLVPALDGMPKQRMGGAPLLGGGRDGGGQMQRRGRPNPMEGAILGKRGRKDFDEYPAGKRPFVPNGGLRGGDNMMRERFERPQMDQRVGNPSGFRGQRQDGSGGRGGRRFVNDRAGQFRDSFDRPRRFS